MSVLCIIELNKGGLDGNFGSHLVVGEVGEEEMDLLAARKVTLWC